MPFSAVVRRQAASVSCWPAGVPLLTPVLVLTLAACASGGGSPPLTGAEAEAIFAGMQTRSQQESVADLRSGVPDRMAPALSEMAAIPPGKWGVELRGALLDALIREIEEKAFGDDPHVALHAMFELANQIAALGDVRAAPVLARHGGFGSQQLELLVSLGEPGLRAVLEFAPETRPDDNGLGHVRVLAALHRYVYDRGVAALDAETLARIRGLADRALAGPSDPMVLEWGAMGLGLLVGGPELRAAVEDMATSDEAVRKRLFFPPAWDRWGTDHVPEYVERIRKEANYLLADPKRTLYYQRPGCGGSQTGFPKPPLCRK